MEEIQSRALQFAIAAGLKPQMAYTVRQTALYSGVPRSTLYAVLKGRYLPLRPARTVLADVVGPIAGGMFT